MPDPETDYLDDDFGEEAEEGLEAELEPEGSDVISTDDEEDLTMNPQPQEDPRSPMGVTDDNRAPEHISGVKKGKAHQEELLDEGVEETFPASDPVSVKRIT